MGIKRKKEASNRQKTNINQSLKTLINVIEEQKIEKIKKIKE